MSNSFTVLKNAGIAVLIALLGSSCAQQNAAPNLPAARIASGGARTIVLVPTYTLIELPTLGGSSAVAETVNDIGWVMGDSNLPGDTNEHAALWRGTSVTDLGSLGGPANTGYRIHNVIGGIPGLSTTKKKDPLAQGWGTMFSCLPNGGPCIDAQNSVVGFDWRNGKMSALPTLGGINGIATAENNSSEITGWAENRVHDPTCVAPQVLDYEGVIWGPAANHIRVLPPLRGDRASAAISINDRGQAVGGSGICAVPTGPSISKHAVIWERGTVRDLGSFGGAFNNFAYAINNRGEVVGQLDLPGDAVSHAFLWSKERGLRDLGTLPGDVSSSAASINNEGTVIGVSCDASGNCRNVLWSHGAIVDFNALLENTPVQVIGINDINDKGDVVGFAFDPATGLAPAFIAIPNANGLISVEEAQARSHRSVLPARIRAMFPKYRSRF